MEAYTEGLLPLCFLTPRNKSLSQNFQPAPLSAKSFFDPYMIYNPLEEPLNLRWLRPAILEACYSSK